MSKDQQKNTMFIKRSDARLTIGFISGHLKYKNSYTVWQGVIDAARERDVNVISFLARDLDTPEGFEVQGNVLYDMINTDMLDGLVVWVTRLTEYAGPVSAKRVLDRYRSIPIVAIERGGPEEIPWVDADNYEAMREMMIHLVKEHGYRRIAFIRGPDETHAGAQARYQAYLDILAEYGLPVEPDLVSPPTEGWHKEAGEVAISLLLDQRRTSFDAVVGVSDEIALGAMEALQARDIHVPRQVAVVGFDDDVVSNSAIPPLTTIPLQGYEMGRRATEVLLNLLEDGQTPAQLNVLPRLIIRQSCGCAHPAVAQAAAGSVVVQDKPLEAAVTAQREKILSEMRQATGTAAELLDPGWTEQFLEAFLTELKADKPGIFLAVLDEMLRQEVVTGGQVDGWENVISALRRRVLPYLGDIQVLQRAEDLWLQAQVMVGKTAQLTQQRQAYQVDLQTQFLDEVREALITTFDVDGLMKILAQMLPRLGIPGCYLSLYENPQYPAETSRLVLAFDEPRGRFEPDATKQVFPSRWLAPEGMLPQERLYSMVVEPLYFRENQLGFVLFEVGPRHGPIYDVLRREISSALQGALLLRERERAEAALEKAYAEVENQVKERTAQLQQAMAERERAQAENLRLQEEMIETQQRVIRELSTPIIPVIEGVVVMPLIGSVDTQRARDIMRALLAGIQKHRARVAILDITGVPIVDSGVANHLNKTIQAAQLKGTQTIVTGMSEAVAEAVVDLGIDWSGIQTLSDLQTGLRFAMAMKHRST